MSPFIEGILLGIVLTMGFIFLSTLGYHVLVKAPFSNATVEDFLPKTEGGS